MVQRTLKKVLKDFSLEKGEAMANYINNHGRAVIHVGDFTECATIRDKIRSCHSLNSFQIGFSQSRSSVYKPHTAIFKFGRLFNMLKVVSLSKINH